MARTRLLLLLAACAGGQQSMPSSTGGLPFAHRRLARQPTSVERALIDDAADRKLDDFTVTAAILIAAGAADHQQLARRQMGFDEALRDVTRAAARHPAPEERARALLEGLYRSHGGAPPILRRYELDATTAADVLETGRYNCVSATLVYIAAAHQLGLDVRPVLMPSHARAELVVGRRRWIVETTTADGFDPDPARLAEVRERYVKHEPGRAALYEAEQGTEVEILSLIAAVYSNASTMALTEGDAALASSLNERAEALIAPGRRQLLREIRASLLNEIALDHLEAERYPEAVDVLAEAARVAPEGGQRDIAFNNILYAAGRHFQVLSDRSDEQAILAFPARASGSGAHDDLRALALSAVGRLRSMRGDAAGAKAALEEARRLAHNPGLKSAMSENVLIVSLQHVAELADRDPAAAVAAWRALGRPADAKLAESHRSAGSYAATRWAKILMDAGECGPLREPVQLWQELDAKADAAPVIAGCHGVAAERAWKSGDFAGAARDLRVARRLMPREESFSRNLVAMLQRLVRHHYESGRCAEAGPLIREGLDIEPGDAYLLDMRGRCGP